MSSGLKYVGLTVLRSTISNIKSTTASWSTISTLRQTTFTRNYQCLINSIDLNIQNYKNCQSAVKNSLLKSTIAESSSAPNLKTSSNFHKYKDIMDAPPDVFKGSLDRFNGITVESSKEFQENDNFLEKLRKSLDYWKEQKRRAIWFHVKTEHSEWIPHLTKLNFEFHHAKNGLAVLNHWLPEDETPNLPVYSHTMLGVGGLVVNDNNEVLVVTERFALIPNSWKLPGGYAEPRENLIDAAIREVREETGVECVFNTVVSIRHAHGGPFGCSDIYCVVGLKPITSDLTRCEREIAKLKWMPCDEYLQHPNVHETNRHFLRCFLDYQKRGIRFTCEIGQHQILKKEYCLYYMKPINEEDGQSVKETDKELGKL